MTKIDWEVVTNYIESVGTTDTVFPFNKPQNLVKVTNGGGNGNLIYTIGSQTGTLTPGQSVTVTETISSITLRASIGKQSFQVWASEAGTEKDETDTSYQGQIDSLNSSLAQRTNQLKTLKSNPTNYNGAVISFIDDDGQTTFNTVWQDILATKGIKIGIAVAHNFIGNTGYLTVNDLKTWQDQGHEILNHSYNHTTAYTSIDISLVEPQVSDMVDYMNTNGLLGSDIFVYPGGMVPQRVEIKDIVRKYCRYGINSANGQNTIPADNWYLGRTFMDTMTIDQLKAEVDTAIANNNWLIFGSHSHVIINNTPSKISDLIDYINSKGVPILPFSEAEKLKGNAIAIGEYSTKDSVFIANSGEKRIGLSSMEVNTSTSNTMDDSITTYPVNSVTIKNLTLTKDTFKGIGGVMTVYRMADDSYSYATFSPNTESKIYKRRWNTSTGAWNSWVDIALQNTDIRMINSPRQIFTVNSPTPSVATGNYFLCNDTAVNTITNFLGGTNGQIIYVGLNNTNTTIQSNTNIKLQGGTNFTGNKNDMIQLIYDTVTWKEISRSNNIV